MCMEKRFHIGEISRFFDLPASTLRYWEETGILTPGKNSENNYREYTVADLMSLSDIIFYKNLGIPLKQINELEHSAPEKHEILFYKKIEELKAEQLQIQSRIEKLHSRLDAIRKLNELREHPYMETDIDTECIVSFDLIEIEKLRQYIENPYLYSRVQESQNIQKEKRGLTIPSEQISRFPDSEVIWKKKNRSYVACLMKEEVVKGYPNNLEKILSHIRKKYRTGAVISRFLLCAEEEGKLYDFYKTFVEIIS